MSRGNAAALRLGPGRAGRLSRWADRHLPALLVSPMTLMIAALSVFPLAYSVWVSFVRYDFRVPGHPWVGLQNFESIWQDPVARAALWHTLILAALAVVIEFALGLALALAMARRSLGTRLLLPVFVFPLFMSPVAIAQTWRLLLDRQFGPIDNLLGHILAPAGRIEWLTDSPWTYASILLADTWQWMPFIFVILLAGLAAIPDEVYEAAELDGARPWQSFLGVTLPLLSPVIFLAISLRLIDALKLFDPVFILTRGGPGTSTQTVSYYLYQEGFQEFHLSSGAAGSWLFLLVIAVIAIPVINRLYRQVTA